MLIVIHAFIGYEVINDQPSYVQELLYSWLFAKFLISSAFNSCSTSLEMSISCISYFAFGLIFQVGLGMLYF